jgi:hypothetical protein
LRLPARMHVHAITRACSVRCQILLIFLFEVVKVVKVVISVENITLFASPPFNVPTLEVVQVVMSAFTPPPGSRDRMTDPTPYGPGRPPKSARQRRLNAGLSGLSRLSHPVVSGGLS